MSQGGILNPLVPMTGGGPIAGIVFIRGYHLEAYIIGLALGILAAFLLLLRKYRKRLN